MPGDENILDQRSIIGVFSCIPFLFHRNRSVNADGSVPKCQNGRLRADLPSISRDHNSATTGPISKSFGVFNMYSSRGRLLGGSTFGGVDFWGSTFGGRLLKGFPLFGGSVEPP